MSCWGNDQGIPEEQILEAVRCNMFHADGNGMLYGMWVDEDEDSVIIQVYAPRRNGGSPSGGGTVAPPLVLPSLPLPPSPPPPPPPFSLYHS